MNAHDGAAVVARADDAFDTAWLELEPSVTRWAARLSDDAAFREDLVQEARVALWERDATRYDFSNQRERAYLRTALFRRMIDVWRGERRRGVVTAAADGWRLLRPAGKGEGRGLARR